MIGVMTEGNNVSKVLSAAPGSCYFFIHFCILEWEPIQSQWVSEVLSQSIINNSLSSVGDKEVYFLLPRKVEINCKAMPKILLPPSPGQASATKGLLVANFWWGYRVFFFFPSITLTVRNTSASYFIKTLTHNWIHLHTKQATETLIFLFYVQL